MFQLTDQQQQEIALTGCPREVTNPKTGEQFILIHKEMFERVRTILDKEDEIAEIEEMYPLVNEAIDGEDAESKESA